MNKFTRLGLFACPYCGRRLSDVVERQATQAEREDKTFHAVRDRLYVLYAPVGIALGQCQRHGLIRVRRLAPVGPPAGGPAAGGLAGEDGAAW